MSITPFHFFEVLSLEECKENLSLLDQHSDYWTPRMPGVPFYTLGTPLYMDKEKPIAIYEKQVIAMNKILRHHFENLLQKARHCLETHLNSRLLDLPGCSLPGFHIFGGSIFFTQPIASIHFDLQYQKIRWPEPPSLNSVVSFTLPIVLPTHGGGLNWWDIEWDSSRSRQEQEKLQSTKTKNYLPYKTGKMVVHNGHLLHQIAPATEILSNDRRVTLQGHATRSGENYYWYW